MNSTVSVSSQPEPPATAEPPAGLAHRTITDVLAVPMVRGSDGIPRAGLFDAEGKIIQDAIHRWGKRPHFQTPDLPPPDAIVDEPAEMIFAGYYFDHYGLFLLNTLARLWFASTRPDLPLAFMSGAPHLGWQMDMLGLLGVTNRLHAITMPTRFRRLVLPEAGFQMNGFFRPALAEFLGCVEPSAVVPGRRCWLSRTGLSAHEGRVLGEDEIEADLAALGWSIYHPERHSLIDQLAFMSSCEVIAGWSGSAFHTLILLRSLAARLHVFARGAWLPPVFRIIADRRGFDQQDHVLPVEQVSGKNSRSKLRVDNQLVLRVLRDT